MPTYQIDVDAYAGVLAGSIVLDESTEVGATGDIYVDSGAAPTVVHFPAGISFTSVTGHLEWAPAATTDVTLRFHLYTDPDFDDVSIVEVTVPSGSTEATVTEADTIVFGAAFPFTTVTPGWIGVEVDSGSTVSSLSGYLSFVWETPNGVWTVGHIGWPRP